VKSTRTRVEPHGGELLTPQSDLKSLHSGSLHGSADQNYGADLDPNSSDSTTKRGQFGPIISQVQ
jgi:hypothetical protein